MTLTGVPRERPQVASKPLYLKWQTQTSNIIYIMRNAVMARLARLAFRPVTCSHLRATALSLSI